MRSRTLFRRAERLLGTLCLAVGLVIAGHASIQAAEPTLPETKIAAERGDAEAQERLADALRAKQERVQAEAWYRKSALAGRGTAQAKLGNLLLMRSRMGLGLDASTRERLGKESLSWILPAAWQGVAGAQADLAGILYEGKLARQDLVEAYKWGALAARAPITAVARTTGGAVRDAATLKMSADQITEAQRRVASFKLETPNQARRSPAGVVSQLQLKGISGTTPHKLALINNTPMSEGESVKMKLLNRTVSVRCIEIGDASVVVAIDGMNGKHALHLGEASPLDNSQHHD